MKSDKTKQNYTAANIEVITLEETDIVTSSNMDPGGWVSNDNW